ncbi:MAG: AAA family ATPase [Candidatus Hatepunaea meridiana]|nr:AAA family ATPase [Candidatus Hatepunaea meridiana]
MNKDKSPLHLDQRFQEILKEQIIPDADAIGSPPGGKRTKPTIEDIRFDINPEELIDYLNGYVVDQARAVEVIATKICTHFHRMWLERENPDLPKIIGFVKSNMQLIGPTGVGKTYLIKLIADKLHVPFVKGDATKFSETGYVGGDVEDLVRELVYQVDGNIKLAEYGIVYIDEIDKIASTGNWNGPDVSRGGVQRNLLKLMEETEVDMKVPHDLSSQMEAVMETQRTGKVSRKKVNTRNILFVMSGAFTGLPEIIAKRLKKGGMGFTGKAITTADDVENLLEKLHALDLIEYGFESEFVGRVPIVTYLNELDEDGLFDILKGPNSAVTQGKRRDFAAYGINLTFDDSALRMIARDAHHLGTGARGLVSVVEKFLLPFERSLPSTDVERLHITEELLSDTEGFLKELIKQHAFESFVNRFMKQTGIKIEFSSGAIKEAVRMSTERGIPLKKLLDEGLKDYEYGLKLVGKTKFSVTRTVISDPKGYLDKLVKQSYKKG